MRPSIDRSRSPGRSPPFHAGVLGMTASAVTPRDESTHSTPVSGATWVTWL